MNDVFGKRLSELFKERDKKRSSLAKHIEKVTGKSITRVEISRWCNGHRHPRLKMVPIIADFFGVTTDYLLIDTEDINQ